VSRTIPPATWAFPGDSDLAAMMRQHDWSATPLGDPATWPQALHTVVRVLLTSRFAMWMGWGPELTFFYNDAYARMTLGAKHPWALGRPSREVWAEIWPQIGPATWDEALMLFLERSGYPEETYHTFSYSPLADDDGVVQGHLCVVTEETERVIGARRLGVLRDVAAAVADAGTETALWAETARVLAARPHDTPFTLTYLFGTDGAARLVCRSGAAAEDGATDVDRLPWPATAARLGRSELVTLDGRFGQWSSGPWDARPTRALLLPIAAQEQGQPAGVFAVALNPYRALDDAYSSFLGLLVGQLSAALARTRALDAERRQAAALAEIDRAKTTFFSNVSHEFRTPLTLLLGPFADALRDNRPLAGPDLEAGHRNALRLLKLVNALLDFARIEAGRAEARFEPVDLAVVTAELASVFRSAIERAGLTYTVRCAALPQPVFIDRDMWEKVVLNLISNALKFTFEGGIRVTLTPTAEGAALAVEDSGTGIAPEDLPRLFERFHRIEGGRARTHEGSGIGLALVQELVQMHGGRIEVDSALGSGSRFVVTMKAGDAHLPGERLGRRAAADTGATAQSFVEEALRWLPSAAAVDPLPVEPKAHRIVVADDNADMREYVTRLLSDRWRVEAVANGRDALAALGREPADLVVTDVMMPELDGFGLLRAMRGDPALAAVPVLMLSARSGEEARIEGLDLGADDYLFKPFSARELVARVGNHLEQAVARREVAAERDRLRSLLGQVPAVVNFLRGPDLVFDFAHPMAVMAAGGRPLQGRPFLEALPELRDQPFYDRLRRAYATGEPVSGHEVPAHLDNPGSSAEERFWTFLYLPIRSVSGAVEGVMTFDLDVTEQVRARQQLEAQAGALAAAREAAEVASRAKDEFLAILGHELRNPLAPILTALEVLRLRGVRSREQEIIHRQVTHLTRLVDDLLDVSRVTRGTIELRRERLELAAVVFRACELAAPLLDERRHVLDIDVPPGLVVDGDPDRLSQVVVNLLTNAAKYSDPGSPIVVRGAAGAGAIELRIADEGVGIPPEMLTRVFQPFVQQPQTIERSRGGLGLGLTIVKTLVEKHGGSVAVSSAGRGLGSAFLITLPAANDQAAVAEPLDAAATTRPAARGQHVLVVDDNADALEMLSVVLAQLGYSVDAAPDGPSALAMAGRRFPAIALLDIGLPEMNGYELARRLRGEAPAGAPLRLIAVTGYGQGTDAARAAAAGFEAHLVKPVDAGRLERALSTAS
jgi:signal transduction histidine kinase/DNA-binding response OmpR family regulator